MEQILFQCAYQKVFDILYEKVEEFGIPLKEPTLVLGDFEMAVINAVISCFGEDILRLCFFHLCQSVYRHIQGNGLQTSYNDPDDRSIKAAAHQLCALAFVPPEDVIRVFLKFAPTVPESFEPIIAYFEVNFKSKIVFLYLKILNLFVTAKLHSKTSPR